MTDGGFVLADRRWMPINPHCLGIRIHPGRTAGDPQVFLAAVFRIARTGARCRDLLPEAAKWNMIRCRFGNWAPADVFDKTFNA